MFSGPLKGYLLSSVLRRNKKLTDDADFFFFFSNLVEQKSQVFLIVTNLQVLNSFSKSYVSTIKVLISSYFILKNLDFGSSYSRSGLHKTWPQDPFVWPARSFQSRKNTKSWVYIHISCTIVINNKQHCVIIIRIILCL